MSNSNDNIEYWVKSSELDAKTMIDLFNTNNYHWALFIGHLVLEKLLKALYYKTKSNVPPMIHDLRRICDKMELQLSPEYSIWLDTITRFNINARYDDYKNNFYKICTKDFSKEWINKIQELRQWIKSLL